MALAIIIIVVCAAAAVFLIAMLSNFRKMGENYFKKALKSAHSMYDRDLANRAEKKICTALKGIGWDYQGLLEARASNRLIGIEGLRSFWFPMAVAMNVSAKSTLELGLPGFLLLGTIYEKKNLEERAYSLYEDLLGYMEGEHNALPRIARANASAKTYARMCRIDLKNNNLLSGLKNHMASRLEKIHLAKLQNEEEELASLYPYQGDALLKKILDKMERPKDARAIVAIVNRNVGIELGKVFVNRALIDINKIYTGRDTRADRTLNANKQMIQSVIETIVEKERVEEEPDDNDSGAILL